MPVVRTPEYSSALMGTSSPREHAPSGRIRTPESPRVGRKERGVAADGGTVGSSDPTPDGAWLGVIVQGMADAVAVLDANAVLQYANPAAAELFGYALADRLGRDILDLVHPEDLD